MLPPLSLSHIFICPCVLCELLFLLIDFEEVILFLNFLHYLLTPQFLCEGEGHQKGMLLVPVEV